MANRSVSIPKLSDALYDARNNVAHSEDEIKNFFLQQEGVDANVYQQALDYRPSIKSSDKEIDIEKAHASITKAFEDGHKASDIRKNFAGAGLDLNDYYSHEEGMKSLGSISGVFGKGFVGGAIGVAASIPKSIAQVQSAMGRNIAGITATPEFVEGRLPTLEEIKTASTEARKEIAPATERAAYKAGESIEQYGAEIAPVNKLERELHPYAEIIGQGLGSSAAFLAGGVVGVAAKAPMLVTMALGAAANSSEMYDDAIASGTDEDTALDSAFWGGIWGTTEALPVERIFSIVKKSGADKILRKGIKHALVKIAKEGGKQAVVEAAQEIAQQVLNNLTKSDIVGYSPETGAFEGTVESGIAGGGVGLTMGSITATIVGLLTAKARRRAGKIATAEQEGIEELRRQLEESGAVPEALPAEALPAEALPAEALPAEALPAGALLAEAIDIAEGKKVATPQKPVEVTTAEDVAVASAQVEREPSEAQKESGNYKKGHVKLKGLDIAIEIPKGGVRTGTDATGKPWEVVLPHDYGYIKKTEGADGDQVDVFIGGTPQSAKVFVIDQINPTTGEFDEHKSMIGFETQEQAQEAYTSAYSDDATKRLGYITELTEGEFKNFLDEGNLKQPFAEQAETFIFPEVSEADLVFPEGEAPVQGTLFDQAPARREPVRVAPEVVPTQAELALEVPAVAPTAAIAAEVAPTPKITAAPAVTPTVKKAPTVKKTPAKVLDKEALAKKTPAKKTLAKKVTPSVQRARVEEATKRYFTPGDIVKSYDGRDKVLDYRVKDGKWEVDVIAVDAKGKTIEGARKRTHETYPDTKELRPILTKLAEEGFTGKKAPIKKAPAKKVAKKKVPEKKFKMMYSPEFEKKMVDIRHNIVNEARRINPRAKVAFFEKMFGEGEALLASGAKTTTRQEVGGAFTPSMNLIEVSLDVSMFDPVDSGYHELWHSLEDLLTSEEKQTLVGAFPGSPKISHDEQTAIAFAKWARKQNGKELTPAIRRIFTKIRQFLRAIGNRLRAEGFKSAEDIFIKGFEGEIGKRFPIEQELNDLHDWTYGNDTDTKVYTRSDIQSKYLVKQESKDAQLFRLSNMLSTSMQAYKDYRASPNLEKAIDLKWFHNAVITPRTIAKRFPGFVKTMLSAIGMYELRDTIAATMGEVLAPYFESSVESKNRINGVLEMDRLEGTSERPRNADGSISVTNTNFRRAQNLEYGKSVRLTGEEVAAYEAVRNAMDDMLAEFKTMVIDEFAFEYDINLKNPEIREAVSSSATLEEYLSKKPALSQKNIDGLVKLKDSIEGVEQAQREGYIPFSRFGNYAVAVKNDAGEVVESRTFEVSKLEEVKAYRTLKAAAAVVAPIPSASKVEIEKYRNELKSIYPKEQGFHISKAFQLDSKEAVADAGLSVENLDAVVDSAGLRDEYYEGFREGIVKELQGTGFRKHFFKSKNTAGYNPDFERAIAEYVTGMSSYIARRKSRQAFTDALNAIDSTKQPKLYKYAKKYIEYIQTPQEEFQRLRQLNFMFYLVNFSTALINLTQVPMITVPYLTMYASATDVATELTRAYADTAKLLSVKSGFPKYDLSKAPADVREDLIAADKDGHLGAQMAMEQMAIGHAMKGRLFRNQKKLLAKTLGAATTLYSSAEHTNRIATYIAAHRLAQKGGSKFQSKANSVLQENALWQETSKEKFSPDLFAKWTVDETHFKVGKVSRPTWFRGVGAAVFQFKQFTVMALELQWDLAKNSGPEGKKAFALIIGMLFLTSGLEGLPFAEDFKEILEALYTAIEDEDIDIEHELRLAITDMFGSANLPGGASIGEIFTQGLLRAGPADVQARLGMGKVLPTSLLKAAAGDDSIKATNMLRDVGGVSADLIIGRTGRAIEAAKNNRPWYDVAGAVSPKIFENPMTAYSWSKHGILSGKTARLKIPAKDIGFGDVVAKSLGFTPSRVARVREESWSLKRLGKSLSAKRGRYYTRLAKAFVYETEDFDSVLSEIDRRNEGKEIHKQILIDKGSLKQIIAGEYLGYDAQKTPRSVRGEVLRRKNILHPGVGEAKPDRSSSKAAEEALGEGNFEEFLEYSKNMDMKSLQKLMRNSGVPELVRITRRPITKRSRSVYEYVIRKLSKK